MEKSMEKLTVNGKVYQAKEVTFNFVCQLENDGISLTDLGNKSISAIRSYVAYCMGVPVEIAGGEIEAHVISGKDIKDISEVFSKKVDESGFFQALNKAASEDAEESATEKKEK